jgi:replicative DNA helicase
MMAYLLAGGYESKGYVTFSSKNQHVLNDFSKVARRVGIVATRKLNAEGTFLLSSTIDTDLFERMVQVIQKQAVPQDIFTLPKEYVALFINTLYASGGWAHNGVRPEIGLSSTSRSLLVDIKHLLLRFGIRTNLASKKGIKELLMHRRGDLLLFTSEIGIAGRTEIMTEINEVAEDMEIYEHTVPKEVWVHIENERIDKGLSKAEVTGSKDERLRMNAAPGISKVAKYADNLESAFLFDLARADLVWEEVTEIVPYGMRQTYDVFVPETHNLVCEDIMVHNTWTMCAHMLWVAFTCNGGAKLVKGATCIVATPYESQARLIFDQLKTFIDNNPVLADSVSNMTKNPYYIQFKNKSQIKLFTAGTRSGSEGGSLRGQSADWIYMDEVDYMSDKDFEAIFAISLEAPQRIGVMVASTPTGRRGTFYKLCTQMHFNQEEALQPLEGEQGHYFDHDQYSRKEAEGWKEFYFPTYVNPEWDVKMEKELKGMYTEVAYDHEVLANFGTEMVGVFNKDYVDEAASDGYVLLNRPLHDGPIAIGVDWDKYGAATQIVVTQYNPLEKRREDMDLPEGFGRFQVINRIEIPKGEFTYDNAVKKLIELDAIYNPAFIYADRGSGEYQIELLRKALGDKVKGIHLGGSHEVRDPHSREFNKKPIKPFMVNQTTMILERGMLRIPSRDIDETILRQMTNYQVVRVSPKTGEPTYTDTDEHALDAMMLGILAFIIEMPEVAKTIEQIFVARKIASAQFRHPDPLAAIYNGVGRTKEDKKGYVDRWDEPSAPPPRKVRTGFGQSGRGKGLGWGARGSGKNEFPTRRGW